MKMTTNQKIHRFLNQFTKETNEENIYTPPRKKRSLRFRILKKKQSGEPIGKPVLRTIYPK